MQSIDEWRADVQKRHAEFLGQFQQTATKVAKRGALVWVGLLALNLVMGLMALAGSVFIVLLLFRLFNVI